MTITIDAGLTWRDVARVGVGETLALSPAAWGRVEQASRIVARIVETGVRAYGVNTGVGALADTVVDRASQSLLSRSIVLSHACGVGPLLAAREVRAIIAAGIANFAHGHSGVRREIVEHLAALLEHDCIPDVPSKGSAGYLVHNAHIALVLIGEGSAHLAGRRMSGREALAAIGLEPLVLGAKEGLSLVNGTACATGLTAVALSRAERLLDWADAIAALTLEAAGCQIAAFDAAVLALRPSAGIEKVGATLRARLQGSGLVAAAFGRRTQDALSLRSVPHAHGAARDVFDNSARAVDQELASVTDNPAVSGTLEQPIVSSEAHAVAPALGQAADSLAIALAQIGAISERRMDRLVNPLVSGLPPFLASDAGSHSGFMIAQYTAAALSNENRRLAAPAAMDGGLTSGLQEDFLAHPTAAAGKLLAVIDNAEYILAIELMAAAQAHDFLVATAPRAAGTELVYKAVREQVSHYGDERPLNGDIEAVCSLIRETAPPL
ncbi:histidine ammonia-lyase (plasmid) [Rhizobium leguminosarum]|uniref:Histidine ammonia-lyase n=1 Tax=Rhizobium johnstonii (strain DSM 114642 / LMG 32736 / 3841) TaxID=216596 RepID=Q1M6H1_RHIJ3|nr:MULTISPECIES: histidine ammonia-lyase [Rhizobium]WSH11855.1 histidine ammonia-lyase [Rhizobium johnstonii]NEI90042.1 histidine ammonia-lyase [Rhizobium leguminosarum]NEJ79482.1 histidine ammonia-lyase [Rhizobium leguminosarum]TBF26371.1 histidine ammonia-lyase [Rhizobium leguminosarum]TBF86965.1 histidine ammonia-lyase [Rhizobium leguminosarum]